MVEVVGVAGAGKTTLVQELVRRDPELRSGIRLSRARSTAAFAVDAARLAPSYVRRYRGTSWFTVDEARAIAYLSAWHRKLRHHPERGVVLFDHGPVFRLAQLKGFGPPITSSQSFQRWWDSELTVWGTTLDLIVWLDASDDVLLQRIRSRERWHPAKEAAEGDARSFIARYRTTYHQILAEILRGAGAPLIAFDSGEQATEEIAENVAAVLRARSASSDLRTEGVEGILTLPALEGDP